MAKAFDDNERKLIKDKLKEGALLFIQQQGVRKTSVAVSYTHLAFLTILNEKTIGTDIYNEVFKFIVRGIVQQLFKD